jgi:hypothetical protein
MSSITGGSYLVSPTGQRYTSINTPTNPTSTGSGTLSGSAGQVLDTTTKDPYAGQDDAARAGTDAEISSLNTEFDRLSALANDQLGYLRSEYDTANENLANQKTGLLSQVGNQITDVNTSRDQNIAEAGDIARSTQGKNRNMLRAIGILNSTAAGDILARPMEDFDKQRASFVSAAQTQVNKLNDFLTQKTSELAAAAKEISNNYLSLVGQIQTDLRFSGRERADAIKSANAALSQRMSDIKMAQSNYQQTTEAQKQNIALQIAQLQGYKFPGVDTKSMLSTLFNPGTQQYKAQTVGLYNPEKDRLSALS